MELNCETDFVARRTEFQNLGKNLAMQIAASPTVKYVSLNDIPDEIWDSEKRIEGEKEDIKSKPDNIKKNRIKGRIEKNDKTNT